jgi:transposase
VRIETFCPSGYVGTGRRPHERAWLANAFLAKAVLGIRQTRALHERLTMDRSLRRLCGFLMFRKLPSESTFSRAFGEFAQTNLAGRAHEALVKEVLGGKLIGHLSRDATAIEARERAQSKAASERAQRSTRRQRGQTPAEMLSEIPTACDTGAPSATPRGIRSLGEATSCLWIPPVRGSIDALALLRWRFFFPAAA